MTRSMRASLTAIGRQLNEDYQPTLAKPLPTEHCRDLVARLVALEINKRGSSRRAIAVLQSRAVAAGAEGVTDRGMNRTTNQMGQSSWNAPLHCCPDQLPMSFRSPPAWRQPQRSAAGGPRPPGVTAIGPSCITCAVRVRAGARSTAPSIASFDVAAIGRPGAAGVSSACGRDRFLSLPTGSSEAGRMCAADAGSCPFRSPWADRDG